MASLGISDFYQGRNIFMTGATGFFGKSLIEKLLRSCPKIGTIYALVRPKRGKKLQERLDAVFQDGLFDVLKKQKPGILEKKVVPIAGDVSEIGLGMSKEDRELIVREVTVIFSNAASVRFDDHLKDAIFINTRSAREMAILATEIKNLAIIVHVSTAFVNCLHLDVEEKMYDPIANWKKMIEIAEKCDEQTLKGLTLKIIDKMPNTYTFSKNLGEHAMFDICKGKAPLLIFRPSVVVSSMKEPVPGWIDNFNGPCGILIAYGKGIMRTLYCNNKMRPDYIPIDITIKAMVVATWDTAIRRDKNNPEILHCASNKVEWCRPSHSLLAEQCLEVGLRTPLNNILWTIKGHTSYNRLEVYLRILFFQLLPGAILDEFIKFYGEKPILKKITKKIYSAQVALRFFMNQEWSFQNDKLFENMKKILPKDEKDWDYEFRDYSFSTYTADCLIGARRYLLKEPDETLPQAQNHLRRIYFIDKVLKYAFYISLIAYLVKIRAVSMVLGKFEEYSTTLTLQPM